MRVCSELDINLSQYCYGQKNSHVGARNELVRGASHRGRPPGAVSRGPHHPTAHRRQGGDRLHVHDPPRGRLASRSSRLGKLRWAHSPVPAHIVLTNERPKPSITPSFRSRLAKSCASTQSPSTIFPSTPASGIMMPGGIPTIPALAPAQSSGRGWQMVARCRESSYCFSHPKLSVSCSSAWTIVGWVYATL